METDGVPLPLPRVPGLLDSLGAYAAHPLPWLGWAPTIAAVVLAFRPNHRRAAVWILAAGWYGTLESAVLDFALRFSSTS